MGSVTRLSEWPKPILDTAGKPRTAKRPARATKTEPAEPEKKSEPPKPAATTEPKGKEGS